MSENCGVELHTQSASNLGVRIICPYFSSFFVHSLSIGYLQHGGVVLCPVH